jgi:hypothetical protein
MTAGFYISGLITPTYTPLRRGRVAMAKKKKDGSGGCGQVLLSDRRFFRLHNPDTNTRTLKRAVPRVIGLRIKRLFPDILSAALTLHQSARTTETHFVKGACADHRTQRI